MGCLFLYSFPDLTTESKMLYLTDNGKRAFLLKQKYQGKNEIVVLLICL